MIMLNFQGMDPSAHSASKCKLTSFIEEHVNDSVPFIAISESWLKPHISDAQVTIPDYEIVRQDRKHRDRGGVLLYVHNTLPISDANTFDDDTCEAVICTIKSINTKVASIYRPPDANITSFDNMLKFLSRHLELSNQENHQDIIVMGDFNLPGISWKDNNFKVESKAPSTSEALLQTFMEDHLLSQYIHQPTRLRNTLDLFLTNNDNLVLHTSSEETELSDHNIVTIKSTYNLNSAKTNSKPLFNEQNFRSLNLHKADYDEINTHLASIDWDNLKSICSPADFPELLRLTVLQVCMLYSPAKSQQSKRIDIFTRERRPLRRRKRKVRAQISTMTLKNPNSTKIEKLRAEIYDIEQKIKESIANQKKERERKALETIKENPRYFYSYSKRFAKRKSTVGPLLNENGDLVHDPKEMADILQKQYASVFSDPSSKKKKSTKYKSRNKNYIK